MNPPLNPDGHSTSTRPYLVRALHDWCTDNGFTPYLAVQVDETVQVPLEYVKNGEIVLNVSFEATSGLKLGNEFIEFRARFGGVARDIIVPVDHVVAIYSRENGQGMAFPASSARPVSPQAEGPQPRVAPAPLRLAPREDGRAPRSSRRAGAEPTAVPLEPPAPRPLAEGPPPPEDPVPPTGGRPTLKRVK